MFFILSAVASPLADHFLKLGTPKVARQAANQRLKDNPDDLRAMAYLGISNCRVGRYEEAFAAFELSGDINVGNAGEFKADTYRAFGLTEQAISLRRELLQDSRIKPSAAVRLRAAIVNDYRDAGLVGAAETAAEDLLAHHPIAALSWIMLAHVEMDKGNLEQAELHLMTAEQRGLPLDGQLALGRWYLLSGYEETGFHLIQRTFQTVNSNRALYYYGLGLSMAEGPQEALAFLDRPKFAQNHDPKVLYLRMQLYDAIDEQDKLNSTSELLLSLYPQNKWIQEQRISLKAQVE